MTATAPVDTPLDFKEYFERIPIDRVFPSPTNPRTHFDDKYLRELAGSIAEKGLIQPIIVRPDPDGRFEIVAGECRWRASQLAGQADIAAIVREYTDEQVLEVQLIENIHRTDLTPLEQAAGYRRLIDTNPTKHSAETIAGRIGMSPAWVWDRLKLNDLVEDAKGLLEAERIGVGHAILIARLKPDQQLRVIHPESPTEGGLFSHAGGFEYDDEKSEADPFHGVKARSVRELEKWIADHIRFDVAHAATAAPLQFEAVAQRVEEAAARPGRGKKVIAITFDHHVQDDARDASERTYSARSFKFADGIARRDSYNGKKMIDAPACEYSVLGVVAAGSESYGQAFEVCVARDRCVVHWKAEIAEREKNAKLREKGQVKKAAKQEASWHEKQRIEEAERERVRTLWKKAKPDLVAACVGRLKVAKLGPMAEHLAEDSHRYKDAVEFLGKPKTADDLVRVLALSDLIGVASNEYSGPREFPKLGKRFGVDVAGILKKHTAADDPTPAKKAGKKRA